MISLRALQHAIALAEHGSFVAAARAVHLSQPALSRSIQALERGIGTKLFDRAAGAVRPTDAGTIFLDRARPLVAQAESLELDARKLRRVGEMDLIVGAATYCADGLADVALARLLRERGQLRIGAVTDHWANLHQALRRHEVHLVVSDTTMAEDDPMLQVEPLAHSQGFFAVRAGHPLAGRPRVAVADVMRYPVATTSRMTARVIEPLMDATPQGRRAGFHWIACESLAMMKGIARGCDAVAILPMRAMFAEVESGELVPLPPRPSWLHGRFGIVTLRDRAPAAAAARFVEALHEVDAATDARARDLERRVFSPGAREASAPKTSGAKRRPSR